MKKSMLFAAALMGCGPLVALETKINFTARNEGDKRLTSPVTIKFTVHEGFLGLRSKVYKEIVLEPGKKASVTLEGHQRYYIDGFSNEGKKLTTWISVPSVGRFNIINVGYGPSESGINLSAPTYDVEVVEVQGPPIFYTKRIIYLNFPN